MRLSQISKELGLKNAEILSILKESNIEIEDNPNAKIPDEALPILEKHKVKAAEASEEKKQDPKPEVEDWSKAKKKKEEPVEVSSMKELMDKKEIEENTKPEVIEHIEAEIPEITGPKVIDKIDLPDYIEKDKELREKRKAERKLKDEERKAAREARNSSRKKSSSKNFVSEEEKEKREKKRLERKRKERENFLKEQRRINYLNKVEQKAPQAKSPESKKPIEAASTERDSKKAVKEQKQVKKSNSLFAKFFRWLYHGE